MSLIESTDTALRLAIVRRAFSVSRRGYDTHEVDELLDTVSRLADDLLSEAAATSRLLAEAEAELVGTRAEARELAEVAAAAEGLLAGARAELRAERQGNAGNDEAEEKLVVAEAELRLVRAAAEHTEHALQEARELLSLEQAARATVETQLAEATARLATMTAEQARDPFAEVGAEVAGLLRAAAEAADAVRARARLEAEAVMAEAGELADAILDDAEAKALGAQPQAAGATTRAGADAAATPADHRDEAFERDVRHSVDVGAGSRPEQAGGELDGSFPFAMEINGHDGGD